jgi:hypothetical protein
LFVSLLYPGHRKNFQDGGGAYLSACILLQLFSGLVSKCKVLVTNEDYHYQHSHVTRMARQVERTTGKYTRVGSKTIQEGFIEDATFYSLSIIL